MLVKSSSLPSDQATTRHTRKQKLRDSTIVTTSNKNRPRACRKYERQRTPNARKQKTDKDRGLLTK